MDYCHHYYCKTSEIQRYLVIYTVANVFKQTLCYTNSNKQYTKSLKSLNNATHTDCDGLE